MQRTMRVLLEFPTAAAVPQVANMLGELAKRSLHVSPSLTIMAGDAEADAVATLLRQRGVKVQRLEPAADAAAGDPYDSDPSEPITPDEWAAAMRAAPPNSTED